MKWCYLKNNKTNQPTTLKWYGIDFRSKSKQSNSNRTEPRSRRECEDESVSILKRTVTILAWLNFTPSSNVSFLTRKHFLAMRTRLWSLYNSKPIFMMRFISYKCFAFWFFFSTLKINVRFILMFYCQCFIEPKKSCYQPKRIN